jgi:hypothetical protein
MSGSCGLSCETKGRIVSQNGHRLGLLELRCRKREESFRKRLTRARPLRNHHKIILLGKRRVYRERHQGDEISLALDK